LSKIFWAWIWSPKDYELFFIYSHRL
jgi:hypothetical protein